MNAAALPEWSEWQSSGEAFTVGLEEEVMLLEPDDLSLAYDFDQVRPQLSPALAERLTPETHGATIELETVPFRSATDAGAELAELRARLEQELRELGKGVIAAGTHPFAIWTDTEISEGDRYRYLHKTMRELARREPTHALHVHVGIPDPEEAIEVANRMRVNLPLLLAISANSPFWQGRDAGLASARTPIFGAFPRVGIPRRFQGYRDYVESLATLIECGAFPRPDFIWWDLRLQPRYGTLEIRIMDAQSETRRTTALAALVQSAVRLEALEGFASYEAVHSQEVLEENRFLAFRDGVDADLLDLASRTHVPVRARAAALIEACEPHARDLGCADALREVGEILDAPGHTRQREIAGTPPDFRKLIRSLQACFCGSPSPTEPVAGAVAEPPPV